jgi:predicted RNase H-like HicB family nuclease
MTPETRESMKIIAVIHETEEGDYWAKVPSLPGAYTHGDTLEESKANLREAVELYLSDGTAAEDEVVQENGQILDIAV